MDEGNCTQWAKDSPEQAIDDLKKENTSLRERLAKLEKTVTMLEYRADWLAENAGFRGGPFMPLQMRRFSLLQVQREAEAMQQSNEETNG